MIGETIAHYRITAKLGEGGMGVVYRAMDTKLNREVAIKILPDSFASDPERLERFAREAQVLAALNHPNIAAVYGIEERAIVMELVEGASLADRIARGPMGLDEALAIARQIADALVYAHDKHVVHRDLKPANVKIAPDGSVKLLDFGLAKVMEDPTLPRISASSPTMRATRAGVIIGTAEYMSPEQARGQSVDKRADIWAFGAVLYEMATGRRAFEGETLSDVLGAVLTKEPQYELAPAQLRRLLRLCLEKDPKKRLHDISAFDLLLESAIPTSRPAAWIIATVITSVIALALALVLLLSWNAKKRVDAPLLRVHLDLGSAAPSLDNPGPNVILSPDGNRVVYAAQTTGGIRRLYTRRLEDSESRELPGTNGAYSPFFSFDGNWVGFFANDQLQKISVNGGSPVSLCAAVGGRGASWSKDGYIIAALSTSGVLSRISATDGQVIPFSQLAAGEVTHRWPHILPDGEGVIFGSNRSLTGWDNGSIELIKLKDNTRKTLQRGGTFGRYLPSGHLTWLSTGGLYAAKFDLKRLEVAGPPFLLLNDTDYSTRNGSGQFHFSDNGSAVYRTGRASGGFNVVSWIDTTGVTAPLLSKPDTYFGPVLSPDGQTLAVASTSAGILLHDIRKDTTTRLAADGRSPLWTPDGEYVFFGSGGNLSWVRANGGDKPTVQPVSRESTELVRPWSFTPDGKLLAYTFVTPKTELDIWTISVEKHGDELRLVNPEAFLQTAYQENAPAFSPDGRWIAYHSNETGTYEVYVRRYPDRGQRWQVSIGGGSYVKWAPIGRQLFYTNERRQLMVVSYDVKGESFVRGRPHLFSDKIVLAENFLSYSFDIPRDGTRVLGTLPLHDAGEDTSPKPVNLLLNFFDEIRRREMR